MKNLELRSSLIKTGVIATLCVFFIYAFAVGDSGGVTGAIGSVFSFILFFIGLIVAVVVSVVVMFGIYFGILYMYNPNTCKQIYAEFRTKLSECKMPCGHSCSTSKTTAPSINDVDLNPLRDNQQNLSIQISGLQSSVESLEKILSTVSATVSASAEEITKLEENASSVKETLEGKATSDSVTDAAKKLEGSIATIHSAIKPLSDKVTELETAILSTEDDSEDNALEKTVNAAIGAFQEELATINTAIKNLSKQPAASEGNAKQELEDGEEHRILSYFTKKADKKKFMSLVADAVVKKMTYAQIGELLDDSLSSEASEVIADHPSLTKDYIRTCKQNN